MKVAFVSPANSIHTVRWVNSLSEKGVDVVLFSLSCHTDNDKLISTNVRVVYLNGNAPMGYYFCAAKLRRYFKTAHYDLINCHYASGYGTLCRCAGVHPVLLNVWGSDVYDFPYQSKLKMKIICKNLRFADCIASTSDAMRIQTKRLMDSSDDNIFVTYFGVDTTLFNIINCPHRRDDGKIVIGIVKTLSAKYGINYLLEAYSIVRRQVDVPTELVIYGKGEQEGELKRQAKILGIEKHTCFMGYVLNNDIPYALSQMDIVALSSVLESFGVSAVEAMAMELPVVATDTDGFKEVVVDGVTGIIVPRQEPTAMAEALIRLINDEQLRKTMGQNGRDRVRLLFDWNANVDTMLDIYRRTIRRYLPMKRNDKA